MRLAALLLLVPALTLPLAASSWSTIPKEVWALKDNPALVAQGAVVLDNILDFQPLYFEQTLRVRILSQAGVAAAEFRDLPEKLQFLDGQVVYPDGRVQPITKRDDFLVRKVVSTVDGTFNEGVLIPPGVTADCVLELRWRELTARGKAKLEGRASEFVLNLPEHYGYFHLWSLGSAYPTLSCEIRKGKETYLTLALLQTQGFDLKQGSGSYGSSFVFKNLPAFPPVPYASETTHPNPRLLLFWPIEGLSNLDAKVPPLTFWQKAVDVYHKDWFLKYVFKGAAYDAFSKDVRKDLTGTPREKARTIAERLAQRTVNIDQLRFDEKPNALTRFQVNYNECSSLNYAGQTGFVDTLGALRLLFHVLLDEGLHPKLALVANRNYWVVDPTIRSPFQFSHTLVGVEEPGQPTLWMDPEDRMVPAGEIPFNFQGIKAITIDSATWAAGFENIPIAPSQASGRTFTYQVDLGEDQGLVKVAATFKGTPAINARADLGTQAPSQREAWFKEKLEGRTSGLAVTKVEVANCLDLTKPLGFSAEGTVPLDAGRLLKLNPFPGMGTNLYLPATMPEERKELILMPELSIQEAHSAVHVPKGYLLKAPISYYHSNRWGAVSLRAKQDPATGDLQVDHRINVSGFLLGPDGYKELKDFLQWVRYASTPELTLEKEAGVK